ncbi:MAG: cellulase family glycosylhydrolase [Bacteroidales bacterium]|nr:cellulase family glycosylhydrolase [Bacteroidales bacterium]MBN2818660.1 cellulase family glycosylhydrolase [Bacteroidales bacterium]
MKKIRIFKISGLFIVLLMGLLICCNPDEETVSLVISPSSVTFGIEGGTREVFVKSNSGWTISAMADWCKVSTSSGDGNGSFTLIAVEQTEDNNRSFNLIIKAGDTIREVEIKQTGLNDTSDLYDVPPDNTDMRDLTSIELSAEMGLGWNIGNSLEATNGETSWGNPLITQQLIDSVKAAGFNSIRIPVAWSKFSNKEYFIIETSWLERVEEVVKYVLKNDMYAVMNIHWDGGWMQPTYADQDYVNNRLDIMWEQIAIHFRDYNDRLLFAGTNEVMVDGDYGTPTKEYYTVQNSFNQTFVSAVRATGGRNVYRHLVVQGFNTNINHTINYAVIPEDVVKDRLFMEVHYYDPYNFTLNEKSNVTQWGEDAEDPSKTDDWGNESYADGQFQKMKTKFIDKGIAVIVGEYGAIYRNDKDGHEAYRVTYNEYITQSIVNHGLIPFYWDNGYTGLNGFGLFNRSTGEQAFPELIRAITKAESN